MEMDRARADEVHPQTDVNIRGWAKNTWNRLLEKEMEKLKMTWTEIEKKA